MIKINKFKKQTDRLLVVSEKKLYKVDPATKIKVIFRVIVELGIMNWGRRRLMNMIIIINKSTRTT